MIKRKLEYFSSFWNYNDFLLLLVSLVLMLLEIHYATYDKAGINEEVVPLGRELVKRAKKSTNKIINSSGDEVSLESDALIFQFIRIGYATLLLTHFFKMLNVAQVNEGVGYLVQMLFEICTDAIPFLTFFCYLNLTFALIFITLYVPLGDQSVEKENRGVYQGIDDWMFLPYLLFTLRQSLGDFMTDTFYFMGKPLLYYTWGIWIMCVTISSMIFLNFLIVTIEHVYERINEEKVETCY